MNLVHGSATTLGIAMFSSVHLVSQTPSSQRAHPALPPVPIPADNPQTAEKVSLGRHLVAFLEALTGMLPVIDRPVLPR
jgi:hypothetical protein